MDVASLTTPHLPVADVPVRDGTVRVRALSRQEALDLRGTGDVFERKMLALAMVDPPMTEDQVAAWQAASPPSEIEAVTKVVGGMSAMDPGVAKEAYEQFATDGDAQFRVPPRPDAHDDRGAAPSGDVG